MRLLKLIFELGFKFKLKFFDELGANAELLSMLFEKHNIQFGLNEVILISETDKRSISCKVSQSKLGFSIQQVDLQVEEYKNLYLFVDNFVQMYGIEKADFC